MHVYVGLSLNVVGYDSTVNGANVTYITLYRLRLLLVLGSFSDDSVRQRLQPLPRPAPPEMRQAQLFRPPRPPLPTRTRQPPPRPPPPTVRLRSQRPLQSRRHTRSHTHGRQMSRFWRSIRRLCSSMRKLQ